jgi:hypothetical protein
VIGRRVAVALLIAAAAGGCRHRPDVTSVPLPANWEHCWWTVIRSTLPVDSVAAAYRRAFVTVGLPNIHWTRSGDTIWVRGGPAPLLASQLPFDTARYGATFWSRAVAFQRADSTHFRLYVAIVPPAGGWPRTVPANSSVHSGIPVCEAVARAASVRWTKRPGDPGNEEKLPVWSRVP